MYDRFDPVEASFYGTLGGMARDDKGDADQRLALAVKLIEKLRCGQHVKHSEIESALAICDPFQIHSYKSG